MRALAGAALLAGAGLLAVAAAATPRPAAVIGPGLAPAVIGLGFLAVGAALWRDREARPVSARPRLAPALPLTLALPLLAAAALDTLGMALALPLVLAPLLAWQTGRPLPAVVLALAATAGLLGLVQGVLGVPLPTGPLAGLLPWT